MVAIEANTVIQEADKLVADGAWDDAIQVLSKANQRVENGEIERRLVKIRHQAFAEVVDDTPPGPWPKPVDDLFPDCEASIPEVLASELTAETIASAIQHHGSLLVRGLVDEKRAAGIREAIDAAFDGVTTSKNALVADRTEWYSPFRACDGYEFGGLDRAFATDGGGVLAVDSPRALFRHLDALYAADFNKVVNEYFGERTALSVKKSTLRRTEPTALAGWHQDGSFLGTDTRSLNIWTAFTPCGVDAPSLDIFPWPFKELVKPGGKDIFDWSISNDTAAGYGEKNIVRPVFETGDALLFDQLTLHRTGIDKSMTNTRYAIEMWFFAASTYPRDQIPLCL
ncbi:phytanoyl-CoA dioxygenase family protein [Candidatus Marimicrobium litorale]|uniref:Phytanoyl-CoA dioxygenase n=1 Tax=Candidatus Marimicrobium litorale TaxID=2518991 RepID=A0ABT3T9G1_9GAMM|nr:phytanoyl-CoA dioxygenase family protein [Candidatus Marimicrobium litorale]MCX2978928.1 hypothetical protein [Candidatus Marimicrobium litorale]